MKLNYKFGLIAFLLIGMAGCSRITTGTVGIEQSYFGHISDNPVPQGMYMSVFTSYFPIDITMTRATVEKMQPKDSRGVSLRDVSVVVTYSLDPNLVAQFYRATKEMDDEPNSDLNTLGLQIMEKSIIPYAVQISTEKSDLQSIAANLTAYAQEIQTTIDKRLNALYPGINPIHIQSVTIPEFALPTAIQQQMDAKAGFVAQLQTIAAQQEVIERTKELQAQTATVMANALKVASTSTGLTPDQIIMWKWAQSGISPSVLISHNN